jgi:hypothetical protein
MAAHASIRSALLKARILPEKPFMLRFSAKQVDGRVTLDLKRVTAKRQCDATSCCQWLIVSNGRVVEQWNETLRRSEWPR